MAEKKFDLYEEVTKRVIAKLESGIIPWEKPWTGKNGAWSRATGKNYSFLNQLLLEPGEYATMKQINEAGGKVNKGAKSKQVVFWKMLVKEEPDADTGETKRRIIPMLRYFNVFNVATDTDLEVKHDKLTGGIATIDEMEAIKDDYLDRSGVAFEEVHGDRAYYAPMLNKVVVPLKEQFENVAEYYSTLFHELGHSTGHSSLLNRGFSEAVAFGDEDYSREELVAELTACSVLANSGIETSASFRNNSAYIQSWLRALNDDKHMLVWASSRAEKAYELIMGIESNSDVEVAA